MEPASEPGVVEVVRRGDAAEPRLLIEVPHGADALEHYQALRVQLRSALPAGLERFFCMNTDVGAWPLALAIADGLVAARPGLQVLLLRCLIPRTFVDVNRVLDADSGRLTAGLPPYVRHPADLALLRELHGRYTDVAQAAYEAVCGAGGLALMPHTYGPVTIDMGGVDDDVVSKLEQAHQPERFAGWPLRPEIDLLTRTPRGELLAIAALERAAAARYRAAGYEVAIGGCYGLIDGTACASWARRYRGQTFCWEVRRDLLVRRWIWDQPMEVLPDAVARAAAPLVEALLATGLAR